MLLQRSPLEIGRFDRTHLTRSLPATSEGKIHRRAPREFALGRRAAESRGAPGPRRSLARPRRPTAPFGDRRREAANPPETRLTETKTSAVAPPDPTTPAAQPGRRRPEPRTPRIATRRQETTSGRGRWRGPRRAVSSRPRPQFAQGLRVQPSPDWSSPASQHRGPQAFCGSGAAPPGPSPPPSATAAERRGARPGGLCASPRARVGAGLAAAAFSASQPPPASCRRRLLGATALCSEKARG